MKKFMPLALVLALSLSLAACGQSANTASAGQSASSGTSEKSDTTITYMVFQDGLADAEIELGKKLEQETGIKVDYQVIPADQYNNLLLTKLNAGECTDIFASQGGKFDIVSQLNVEKNAVDLTAEAWSKTLDPLAAAELIANGKLYGQPVQDISAVWALAYNKTIFTKLGLSVPKTYDEFTALCEKIKAASITPIYECVSDGWHHVLWFPELGASYEAAEPGLIDKLNSNQTTFAQSSVMKKALEQIKNMVDKGYWGTDYMSNTYADAAKNFASGKYAMVVANQGFGVEVEAIGGDLKAKDVGFFVMPLVDNQILNVNPVGPSRFIFSGSKNKDAAKEYLAYLAKPESIAYLVQNVPKNNTLPYIDATNKYSDSVKEFMAAYPKHGTVLQTTTKYVNPQWVEIGKEMSAMILGDTTSDKVLQTIDKNRADQANAAKDPAWSK